MLSKRITLLRKGNGWSQAELARRLHISSSAVGMYEQGRREPSIKILIALAKEFNVTVDYLITDNFCIAMSSKLSYNDDLSNVGSECIYFVEAKRMMNSSGGAQKSVEMLKQHFCNFTNYLDA